MNSPDYIVFLRKPKLMQRVREKYEFNDEIAARQFWNDQGGYLFENKHGHYLEIKK